MKSDKFWDWVAKWYDKRAQKDEDYTRAVERFGKYLKADATVLDYACGTGVVTFKIAANVQEVFGIDTSTRMIELAKMRARQRDTANVRFARKTIFDEEFDSKSYDVILAFNVIHLLKDAQAAVQRASELLKPGGLMISETPCMGKGNVILRTLLPLFGKVLGISYLRTLRISEMRDLFLEAGFMILESEVPSGIIPSYFVVAQKQ